MKKGFTLVELLITVAVVVIIALGVVVAVGGLSCSRGEDVKKQAEEGAWAWAESMKLKPEAVSCVPQDSDGDGYIACSISVKKKDGEIKIYAIECAGGYTWNKGCRTPKPSVQSNVE